MPNKIYGDVSDYLVEGKSKSGYIKIGGGYAGDKSSSKEINTDDWYEGKKPGVGKGKAS